MFISYVYLVVVCNLCVGYECSAVCILAFRCLTGGVSALRGLNTALGGLRGCGFF